MSDERIRVAREILAANRSGPPEETSAVALRHCDPRIELRSRLAGVEGRSYRGHAGIRSYYDDMADAWQDWRNDAADLIAVGSDAVVVDNTFRGVGKGSGAPIDTPIPTLIVFAGDKVIRAEGHRTVQEAMEAAGAG